MTPALPDILRGLGLALGYAQPPEAGSDYLAGRVALIAMLAMLAAQEAERGAAARVWENQAMRQLFGTARDGYGGELHGFSGDAGVDPDDHPSPAALSWSALDEENAVLRRRLIALHEAVEARADAALDREILALYQAMARARRLELPTAPAD